MNYHIILLLFIFMDYSAILYLFYGYCIVMMTLSYFVDGQNIILILYLLLIKIILINKS